MKKSLKTIVAISALSLTLGAALAVGGNAKDNLKETKADGAPLTVYLDASEDLANDASYWAWHWKANTDGRATKLTQVEGKLYSFSPGSDDTHVIFVRHSASVETWTWDGKWSQTGDLNLYEDGKDKFTFSNSSCDSGTWSRTYTQSDSYVYYVTNITDGNINTPDTIYAWGAAKEFGLFPGKSIASIGTEVQGDVKFQGTWHKIYRIPVSSAATEHFMFVYNSGEKQTSSLEYHSDSAYWWTGDANYHNDSAGEALDFIVDFEKIRKDADYMGYSNSVCGINPGTAATLYNNYLALDDSEGGAKSYVDSSKTNAYYGKNESGEYNWETNYMTDFTAILAQLRKIAVDGNQTVNDAANPMIVMPLQSEANYTAVIILASTLALVAVGGYFLLRKARKED